MFMSAIKSFQLIISGKVQNVGFRYHTREKAMELGIRGFVQNRANGDVYVEAEANDFAINEFVKWCKKGPGWAHVIQVQIMEQPFCNYQSFEIKR